MKDRNKSSRKKSTRSPGARSAKRTGSGGGARRSRAASPAGESIQQTVSAQIEARFRAVFESSRDAIGVSKAGIHVFVNPAYLELFGIPAGTDISGKPVLDLIAPGNRDQVGAYIRRRIQGEYAPSAYETRGLRADGSEFDMEVNVSIYQENGEDHTLVILRDITERKRAAEEIAEHGAMLQQIMDTASVAIGLVDKTGRITHVNRRMAEMFGRKLEELVGCEYVELIHPSEKETGRKSMLALLASEIPSVDLERLYWRKDGTQFWGHLACRRFHDIHGKELGLIGVITEIDKRKQFELALKQSEAKYKRLYNETPILLQSIDRNGNLVEVNDYWLKTLGYERNEVIGRKVTDFYSTASRKYAEEVALPAFFRDGSVKDISYQFIKKNGEVVDVLLSANAERDDAGNVVRSQAVIENITERKKVDEALKENLAQFRALVEQSITGINVLQNGVLVYVNSRMAEIFGYQPEEMIGKSPLDFVVEADREMVRESIRRRMSGDTTSEQFIVRIMHKDGTERTLELYSIAITYKGGHAFMSTVLDITERKKAEERLRQHEAYLHGILQSTADGILAVDNNSNTITANKRFAELWKIPQNIIDTGDDDMMLHFVLSQLIDPIAFLDKIKALYGSDELGMDTLLFKDGRIFERYSAPLLQQGTRMGRVWSFRDVTERRKLEEQLRQAQKMEAIGTLAGGIAHDFNNLLQGVFGYISLARLKRDDRDKSMDALEEAEKALHMSVKLTNQLLTFSKGGKPVKRLIDLRPVIENSTKFSLSGSRSDYRIVDDDDLWQAEADEGQISQVIQNIVLNADQAMPEGGRLEITARNVHVPGNNLPQGLQEGKYVEIAIKDSGIGIREQYLEKVFDPYFTTKEKGSGLGLATSYSIIKNHDGLINVKSEPGTGTTFFIYIPATGEPHKADVQKSEPATYACQPCRVLVMDDEQMIRDVAGELLKALGHEVEFAGRGEDTIVKYRMAKQAEKPFDVVILDLTIRGGMGGAETIQKLLALDPDVKAIVSSGYSDDAALSNYREQGFRAFLKKPYNLENLRRTLNSLLA